MRDCDNVAMRDLLPDLLHDRLTAGVRAEVESHVKGCADCRAELELLRSAMAGLAVPRVDASRIAAGLTPYRAPTMWASAARSWPLRAAAGIVLLIGVASVVRDGVPSPPDTVVAAAQSPEVAVGALTDIAEQDLRALAAELRKLQAVTPAEPEVVVPGIGRGGE